MTAKKKKKHVRPSWDEYFMELANTASKRATCDRGRSGCVIVRDKQVLVSGYVGSPMGMPHCDDVGHLLKKVTHDDGSTTEHCMRTVHAEQNALVQAAKLGVALKDSTLYCRMTPCRTCAMLIINGGIEKVIAERRYPHAAESEAMFKDAGVKLVHVHDETQQYE
ncbi:MAG: cytidine/deoxycytidylate deaminase family protein [Candidatus Saccharimonadales bacterium]|nr:cytidine/deoxycytidylate deaminase family protein [Candidatus Saccharimonadales bacterium]